MPTKQYIYGSKAPHANLDRVREQLFAAHRYRNKLCELELARRKADAELLRRLVPHYEQAESTHQAACQAVEAAEAAIKQSRAKARQRKPPTPEQRKALADAKAERKRCAVLLRDVKEAIKADPQVISARQAASDQHAAAVREARAASGLYWGTYLTVEDAAKTMGQGPPPRFLRYQGEGTLSVQLQNGLDAADALAGNDTRLQVVGSGKRRTVRLRIGSEGRQPIFAEIPVFWHRDLPEGASIKWAHLTLRRTGPTEEWSVRMVADVPEEPPPATPHEIVAVHCGWRTLPDGRLRVATAAGSDGTIRELCLDTHETGWLRKASDLQEIRDKSFDAIKLQLSRWLKDRDLPEWLREATASLHAWKSESRLAGLVIRWRSERFEGDEGIFPVLEEWRRQDKHLWLWHAHGNAKQIRRRADLYRCWVAQLAEQYGAVAIAKVNWRELLAKPAVDEDEEMAATIRRRGKLAAPGILTQYLKEKFASRVEIVSAVDVSRDCCGCGARLHGDAVDILRTCERCGPRDQDHNAALATLARGRAAAESRRSLASQAGEGVALADATPKVSARQARFRAARERRAMAKRGGELR